MCFTVQLSSSCLLFPLRSNSDSLSQLFLFVNNFFHFFFAVPCGNSFILPQRSAFVNSFFCFFLPVDLTGIFSVFYRRFTLKAEIKIRKRLAANPQIYLLQRTEKEGFEPSRRYKRPTPLAGAPLQPLEYFSNA